MILPILAYGDPVLRQETDDIEKDYPKLNELISNMWETMYNASGIGLAAPQVGKSIRLFIVDTLQLKGEDFNGERDGIKEVFINATILSETGKKWAYEEGCLSIPGVREDVYRNFQIEIEYLDENFQLQTKKFDDLNARVIQHEYDHVDGVLFTDYVKPLKKRMLKKKLNAISKGEVDVSYKMKFPVAR